MGRIESMAECTAYELGKHFPGCSGDCRGCMTCAVRGVHWEGCSNNREDRPAADCPGCARRFAERGFLCQDHYDRAAEALRALPAQWWALEAWLKPGEVKSGQVYVTGTIEHGLPLNITVSNHRDYIQRMLARWVMRECKATIDRARPDAFVMYAAPPTVVLPKNPRVDVTARWLHVRMPTICQSPFAGDFAAEVIKASKRAHGLAHPDGRKVADVGECPEEGCSGRVRASINPSKRWDEWGDGVRCDADDRHTWSAGGFVELAGDMGLTPPTS